MLAWILETTGHDPSFLIGGMPRWSGRPFRLGCGRQIVIEGDEYNTAFFDRGPKFLHYRPHLFLLGPVEFDHGDIYRDLDAVLTAFRAGAAQVPRHGAVVVNAFSEGAVAAARDAAARIVTVGPGPDCTLQLAPAELDPERSTAVVRWAGHSHRLELPLAGAHNLHNAAMAMAAAATCGVEPESAVAALGRFPGVVRRLRADRGGGRHRRGRRLRPPPDGPRRHHRRRPPALARTPSGGGLRAAIDHRRAPLLPGGLRGGPGRSRPGAGGGALPPRPAGAGAAARPPRPRRRAAAAGRRRRWSGDDDPVAALAPRLAAGDVVLGCSSGSFNDFHRRLLEALEAR